MSLDDMRKHIINGAACLNFMDAAEADGLIDVSIQKHPHRTYQVELTDLGREIVSFLLPALELVAPGKPLKNRSVAKNYADPVLRSLHANGVMIQSDLQEIMSSWRTLKSLLDSLEEDGLIESEISFEGKKHWNYRLTPLGKIIANAYQLAHRMIVNRAG